MLTLLLCERVNFIAWPDLLNRCAAFSQAKKGYVLPVRAVSLTTGQYGKREVKCTAQVTSQPVLTLSAGMI